MHSGLKTHMHINSHYLCVWKVASALLVDSEWICQCGCQETSIAMSCRSAEDNIFTTSCHQIRSQSPKARGLHVQQKSPVQYLQQKSL